MQAVSKSPWWIAFPASIGLGLVSIFAPEALPKWVSVYSFWLGAGLIALGTVVSICLLYANGWFDRHVWWRFKLSAPITSDNEGHEAPNPESRWMPMHEVFRYLAFHSRWSECAAVKEGEKPEDVLRKEFLDACSRGDLTAVGRVQISRSPMSFSAASQAIPKEFWSYAFVQPFYEVLAQDDARCVAVTESKFSHVSSGYYCEICLLRSEVFNRWPRALQPLASLQTAPVRTALQQFLAEVRGNPNQEFDAETDILTA